MKNNIKMLIMFTKIMIAGTVVLVLNATMDKLEQTLCEHSE